MTLSVSVKFESNAKRIFRLMVNHIYPLVRVVSAKEEYGRMKDGWMDGWMGWMLLLWSLGFAPTTTDEFFFLFLLA